MEKDINPYYKEILDFYYKDDSKELCRLVNRIVNAKFGGVANHDMPEFFSEAGDVLSYISLNDKYDASKGDFEGFLYKSLEFAFIDMLKKQTRDKRTSKIEVEVDCEKRRVPVKDIYLETPIGDSENTTIGDIISSDFNIDTEILDGCHGKVEEFLNNLSNIQRDILKLKMNGYSVINIRDRLNLSAKAYEDNMKAIRQNQMISMFNKGYSESRYKYKRRKERKMDTKMGYDTSEIMDLDTTDSYRRDNCALRSLLEDIESGEIDRYYISQRAALIWDDEQINKYYSRVLNNQPVPEIVVCETTKNGEKISYLVEGLQRLSYAEEFKENRIPVKAKGAEFVLVRYKKYQLDDNGKKVLDENGRAKYTIDIFNIVGKFYRDLPEFLQKRFDNYNITVTRYFNCTPEMIDYHIRNYNNHVAMTKSQYGITNVSNETSRNIKAISKQHTFFKNNIQCTDKNRKKGALDELVARSIMAINYLDDWKKDLVDTLKYIDKNATYEQYGCLKENLDRLSKIVDKSVQDLFNTTNGYIWLAVFDKFTRLGLDDSKFTEFMRAFKDSLHSKEINGRSYDLVNKRNTRDKTIVVGKIDMISDLMYDYFQISEEKDVGTLEFVQENINPEVTQEDIDQYEEILDDLTLNVDNSSRLLDKANRASLIALVAYSFEHDIDLDNWIIDFFKHNKTYIRNMEQNYLHMKKNLDDYVSDTKNKSA